MRYQSLLLSSFLVTIIALPLTAQVSPLQDFLNKSAKQGQSDITLITRAYALMDAGMEGKNVNQVFAYASTFPPYKSIGSDEGKTTNLQQAKQETSKMFQNTSNFKYRSKVESISYNGQSATVSGTNYTSGFLLSANNSFSGQIKFQDTWTRTSNGWRLTIARDLSSNLAWATPKRQAKPTRQSNHNLSEALSLGGQAIDECIDKGRLEACDRLTQIKSRLSTWCSQGDQEACDTYGVISLNETSARGSKMIEKAVE
jgi:hypothetical protein